MYSSHMGLHTYGTSELPALGKAPPGLAACFVAGTNPNTLEHYLKAQSFSVSRCGFALNLLGDLGQASSLLCGNDADHLYTAFCYALRISTI